MSAQFVTPEQITLLNSLAKTGETDSERRRARILLLYNAGQSTRAISAKVGLSERSVRYWRNEFLKRGMKIFSMIPEVVAHSKPRKRAVAAKPKPARQGSVTAGKKPAPAAQPAVIQFPRVRKKPGITLDDAMDEAGRKILHHQFAHMLSHEKGTRLGEDIEELHDMRVATRRMRAAFEVFKPFFHPKIINLHIKGLRSTGRALGRVRDMDVFMEKVQQYLSTITEAERPGLDPLISEWKNDQTAERDKLAAYLDSERYQQFKINFNHFVSTPGLGAVPVSEKNPKPILVRHIAPVLVYTHLGAVRAYESVVSNAAIEQLHALRIAFKKFRYTVEFFGEVLGEQAKEVINEIKTLQDHLGNLNDADVACRIIGEFVETWENRQLSLPLQERQNPEPVVAYLAAKHAELYNLMVTFPEAWAHFNRPDLYRKLALSISVF